MLCKITFKTTIKVFEFDKCFRNLTMNKLPLYTFILNLFGVFILSSACADDDVINALDKIDITSSPIGVVELPSGVDEAINAVFVKYTKVIAPNGRPIHIFGQDKVSDEKMERARKILEMYLTDVPGSKYGSKKFMVANSMADRNAALFFFNIEEDEESSASLIFTPLNGQALYGTESFLEGSPEYLSREPRDASYEEILHLTQDYGIAPTMPLYQREIDEQTEVVVASGLYQPPDELPDTDRDQEYLALAWDSYMGSSYNPDEYNLVTRTDLQNRDPKAIELVEMFLPTHLTYNAKIHESFSDTFYMNLKESGRSGTLFAYTLHSQYLTHATLSGNNPSSLDANDRVNQLTGNSADNGFTGRGGDDILDGGDGIDTAIYRGAEAEYDHKQMGADLYIVSDSNGDRDGTDQLRNIEVLRFTDKAVNIK